MQSQPRSRDLDEAALHARIGPAVRPDAAHQAAWQALADNAAEPNAFAEPWFVAAAIDHLGDGRDLRLVEVYDSNKRLVGLLLVTLQDRYGRMPARHVVNWMHFQCFMGTPLIARGYEMSVWRAIIAALDASDWAAGFLSLSGLAEGGPVHRGLLAAATALGREAPTVHRYERALLASSLDGDAYLAANLRGKKRKELRRLANRLGDLGSVGFSRLESADQLAGWGSEFLRLEASGWKGCQGAALANDARTEAFFRTTLAGAFAAGRLDLQRLDLDGRAIAMLVNFRTPPGSWSFKIAYDEALARFSPGVLIELENLPRILADPEIAWMDSCAVPDHPMINSLWGERRAIIQVSVPLSGARRLALYRACRVAETASARWRHFRSPAS